MRVVRDAGHGPVRPKSPIGRRAEYLEWVRIGLIAGGVDPGGLTIEDAHEVACMLAAVGRIPPAVEWVPWVGEYREAQKIRARRY